MTRPSLAGKRVAPGTGTSPVAEEGATNPVYDRASYHNQGNPSPGGQRGDRQEEEAPQERPPLFEVAECEVDGEMARLFQGEGEREVRFMVRRFRRHRGVTTLLPVGRKSADSAGENSSFMKRYREGRELAAVTKGDTFQNRM